MSNSEAATQIVRRIDPDNERRQHAAAETRPAERLDALPLSEREVMPHSK